MNNPDAYSLRETTGTSAVAQAARQAAEALADKDIGHLIVGGLAVQEHGYPRVTIDVDLVVPDVLEAVEVLTASLTGPFFRVREAADRVEFRPAGVPVDLLPAGRVVKRGCKIPFPQPGAPSAEPRFVSLENLIALKLDSWSQSQLKRLRDRSDVVELILRRKLPRELPLPGPVSGLYLELWDALKAET